MIHWRSLQMFVRKVFVFLLSVCLVSSLCSGLSYYTGPISVISLDVHTTFVNANSADVQARYVFWNNASENLSLPVQFLGFPSSTLYGGISGQGPTITLSLPSGETTVTARFTQPFDSLTSLTISPGYLLEGKTPVQKVGRIEYVVDSNEQLVVVVESAPPLTSRGASLFGTTVSNAYPLSLYLTLQQTAMQASVSRTISAYSQVGDELTFTTVVRNTGQTPLSGLTLQDSLFALYFEPVSSGYVLAPSGGVGESLYLYTSPSFSLAPEATKTLTYTAKVTQLGAPAFPGARLFSGNNYITSSEETTATVIPVYVTADTVEVSTNETAYVPALIMPFPEENETRAQTGETTPVLDDQEKTIFAEQRPGTNESSNIGWFIVVASSLVLVSIGGIYYLIRSRRTIPQGAQA